MPYITPVYQPCGHRGNPIPTYASAEGRAREWRDLSSRPCPICKMHKEMEESLARVPAEVKARVADECRNMADFWKRQNGTR